MWTGARRVLWVGFVGPILQSHRLRSWALTCRTQPVPARGAQQGAARTRRSLPLPPSRLSTSQRMEEVTFPLPTRPQWSQRRWLLGWPLHRSIRQPLPQEKGKNLDSSEKIEENRNRKNREAVNCKSRVLCSKWTYQHSCLYIDKNYWMYYFFYTPFA